MDGGGVKKILTNPQQKFWKKIEKSVMQFREALENNYVELNANQSFNNWPSMRI